MLRAIPTAVAASRGDAHSSRPTRVGRRPAAGRPVRRNVSDGRDEVACIDVVSGRNRFGAPLSAVALMSVLAPLPAAAEGLEVWRFPDGSNPLEALFAGPTPIPGITGEITGVWFGDLFAFMNLTLLVGLIAFSAKSEER
jgi:hypothetical protein